ncbi:MAG: DUF2085 domain-containing protein [Balneolaceae bacterium]
MIKEIQFENKTLYFIVGIGVLALFIIGLGPGLFSSEFASSTSWQYYVFKDLCHQETARSYALNGVQMAVCTRCIGIYGSLLAGWILLPFLSYFISSQINLYKWLFSASIVLNLVDVLGNFLELWSNTNNSRLFLGIALGTSTILFLKNDFFKQLNARIRYGK